MIRMMSTPAIASAMSWVVRARVAVPVRAMKVLRFLQRERYLRVAELKVAAATLRDVGRIQKNYLRYVLERDLKSAEFIDLVDSTSADR